MKKLLSVILCCVLLLALTACERTEPMNAEKKLATPITEKINAEVYQQLDFSDEQEREFAMRGLMAKPDELIITDESGQVIWGQESYEFVRDADAPNSANPSLWRNTQLNAYYGLFEVTDGIYQVRGYDLANLTFVRSEHGWIILDCMSATASTKEALELFESVMGEVNIIAIVISHAHVDHYGGVCGLIDEDDLADPSLSLEEQLATGKTPVIVPEGFEKAVMSENVFAGAAMKRRSMYQYGSGSPKGETGSLSVGIGLTTAADGPQYLPPTFEVTEALYETEIDGVHVMFQLTPDTESPAEMNTYFPDSKALWMAENCTGTMHNLYTLRGAQVRDANAWAQYIMEAKTLFANDAQVVFQSHNWPHWGNEVVKEYLTNTAAVYKFIHDQTLLYINQGYTATEIADMIQLPEALNKIWYTRQYYGTLKHNAKAVYQKYMGWYDANPIHLDELTPSEYAQKLVEYLGDTDKVIEMARKDFEAGEYQWVAQITNTLVFADPENWQARYLCADALEQLGYQAESGAWRNAYLTAASELRHGTDSYPKATSSGVGAGATAQGMDAQTMLDYLGIRIDTNKLADISFTVNLRLTDGEDYMLNIHHGILLYEKGVQTETADLTIQTKRLGILALASQNRESMESLIESVEGDVELYKRLCESIASPELFFNIIEP